MSIKESKNKIKPDTESPYEEEIEEEIFDLEVKDRAGSLKKHIFMGLLIVLTAVGSFGLGRLSFYKSEKTSPEILFFDSRASAVLSLDKIDNLNNEKILGAEKNVPENSIVVGSKNSDKYHYPWCSGAKRIAEANKIVFSSIEEARKAGYVPASNCKGLR